MARTSRRTNQKPADIANVPVPTVTKEPAAAYVRLSVEKEENDTIETQLDTLKDYISNSGTMYLESVYIDNGYTGTNFDRPQFNRMMADARSGKIKCIVVKDLSRFGRNFLESGYYIETLLPKLNVRLIAVNDDFDSGRQSDKDALSVPIKNMVNEFYARDYSKKVSDMNAARRKSGNYTIEKSVYGYSVDKEKNEYYVNPETAPIVQLIFRWFLAGYKGGEIANRLNLLGVITPQEYKCLNESNTEMTKKRLWDSGKVMMILRRDAYVGDRCLGTKLTALYKNYKDKKMPRDTWTIYENDHEALVTREDFEIVQKMLAQQTERRRAARKLGHELNPEFDNLFTNMVYCGNCNRKLHIETKRYTNGRVKMEGAAYVCKGRIGPDNTDGCYLRIELDTLKIVVTDQIQMIIKTILDQDEVVRKLRKKKNEDNPIHKYRTQISSLVMKERQCTERIGRLYEDLSTGMLEEDDYKALKVRYQSERQRYSEKITEYRELLHHAEDNIEKFCNIADALRNQYYKIPLDRELLEYLIDKIIVYDDRRVEIRFNFEDVFLYISSIAKGGDM